MSLKHEIKATERFKEAYRALYDDDRFYVDSVIEKIANDDELPLEHYDHTLKGDDKEVHDCHVKPNMRLFYKLEEDAVVLIAVGMGPGLFLFRQ